MNPNYSRSPRLAELFAAVLTDIEDKIAEKILI